MPLALLCLGLTVLGALQTQAQDSDPTLIPAPSVLKVPLQPDFRDDQFQGKWYVVGLAGNLIRKEQEDDFKMHSTTYELKADHSFNVTSTMLSDEGCEHWNGTFVPSSRPGRFNLSNIQNFPNMRSYTAQVVATDYREYAIMFFKKTSGNTEYFKTSLYGRTKKLHPILREIYLMFARSLGLTDDHTIFPVPIDECIDD